MKKLTKTKINQLVQNRKDMDEKEAEEYWREGERELQGPLFDESSLPPWKRYPKFIPVKY